MNQTQNNSNTTPLTVDEINSLHGEELKKVLADRLQKHKDDMAKIDASLTDITKEVEAMPEPDEAKDKAEDDAAMKEITEKLDTDLNNAVLDLATDDETLKDIE